jgi:hypothetical protein
MFVRNEWMIKGLVSMSNEDRRLEKQQKEQQGGIKLHGNYLLFYAFDIGDEIDLEALEKSNILSTHVAPLSPWFKDYHIPLSFQLAECDRESTTYRSRTDCISSKMHSFGAISLCYKIPFVANVETLKEKFIEISNIYGEKSLQDLRNTYSCIQSLTAKPHLYNMAARYSAVQVDPLDGIYPDEFKNEYGSVIASLIRHEKDTISVPQQESILRAASSYYGSDMVIIDGEAAFIYDDEYYEVVEFFESSNLQKLELRYFDRLLDQKLNSFYNSGHFVLPWSSYVPLIRGREDRLLEELARLRVDISVIVERLEMSIKLSGDSYHEEIYSMLVKKLQLSEWRDSVNKKLSIIEDLYAVIRDRLATVREEMMTLVIIILIAVELLLAFSAR